VTASTLTTQFLNYSSITGSTITVSTIVANGFKALWMPSNGGTSIYITTNYPDVNSNSNATYGRYFGDAVGVIYQDFYNKFKFRGTDNVGAVTNGDVMTILQSGNVGIGSNIPGVALDVVTAGSIETNIRISSDSTHRYALGVTGSTPNALNGLAAGSFFIYDSAPTVGGIRFVIGATGNVGIGSASPAYKLDVVGDGKFSGNLGIGTNSPSGTYTSLDIYSSSTTQTGFQIINSTSRKYEFLVAGSGNSAGVTSGGFFIYDTAVRFVIASTGNVGIGSATPASKLDVAGGANFTNNVGINASSTTSVAYNINSSIQFGYVGGVNEYFINANQGDLIIRNMNTNGAIRIGYGTGYTSGSLILLSNGNVGIGTTDPKVNLDVVGSIQTTGSIQTSESFKIPIQAGSAITSITGFSGYIQITMATNPFSASPPGQGVNITGSTYAGNYILNSVSGSGPYVYNTTLNPLNLTNTVTGGFINSSFGSVQINGCITQTVNTSTYPLPTNLYLPGSGVYLLSCFTNNPGGFGNGYWGGCQIMMWSATSQDGYGYSVFGGNAFNGFSIQANTGRVSALFVAGAIISITINYIKLM